MLSLIENYWQKLVNCIRWLHVNFVRILLGGAPINKLTGLNILYESENFIVVNKQESVKINSDDKREITVETQLRHCRPHLIDSTVSNSFRYAHLCYSLLNMHMFYMFSYMLILIYMWNMLHFFIIAILYR